MFRVVDKRGTGKTGRLMLLAKEKGGIIVCKNPGAMKDKAYRYGIVGVDFLSYTEYEYMLTTQTPITQPVFIDEIEAFIHALDSNVQGYTLSYED